MQIKALNNYNYKNNISFERRLEPFEKIQSRVFLNEGKKAVGLDNMVLVTHTPSLPSEADEDTGIGVLSKNKGALSYIDFAYNNAFDGIMVEPGGIISGAYYSPYEASLMSKKAVVDLKALTGDDWASILPMEDYQNAVRDKNYSVSVPVTGKDGQKEYKEIEFEKDRVIYDYALSTHQNALKTAYSNFKQKVADKDTKALELNEEFEEYKKDNGSYLVSDAIYRILSTKYDNTGFADWKNELHRTLFDEEDTAFTQAEKDNEIEAIKRENEDGINFHLFSQFVVDKQQQGLLNYAANIARIKESDELAILQRAYADKKISARDYKYLTAKVIEQAKNSRGVNVIGDKPVGYSAMDIWSNPSLFTKDEYLGAPPNVMKGRMGQDWNFPFIPREKLFDDSGELGKGGVYLKDLFKKMLKDNPGGLRIDHILGLIDPWTYAKNDDRSMTPGKFRILLLADLKELNNLGITPDTIKGIEDPIDAIKNPDSPERAILEKRGVKDFDRASQILSEKADSIEKVLTNQSNHGSRYIFKALLNTHLSGLKEFGLNEDMIKEIIDPMGAIYGIGSSSINDRRILEERGFKPENYDRAKEIIEANKDAVVEEYSKIIGGILLRACEEVVQEKAAKKEQALDKKELSHLAKSLVVCEDLGTYTLPLKLVMEKYNLTGMRHAAYSNPTDATDKYREINPEHQGHYWLVGTHDDPPYINQIKKPDFKRAENAQYISKELGISKKPLMDAANPYPLMRAKIARIISADNDPKTPNNVILNWLDLLGKNKQYNTPGLNDKHANWTLRVSSSDNDFEEELYDETIPEGRGINMAESMHTAMKACNVAKESKKVYEGLKESARIAQEKPE